MGKFGYLLRRAEQARTRRYLRRSSTDDLVLDFAQDCQENPERVPFGDTELYDYLHRRAGHFELHQQITGRVIIESGTQHSVFAGSVLDWLWHRYLRVRP
jgi:hypothetical protein